MEKDERMYGGVLNEEVLFSVLSRNVVSVFFCIAVSN